MAAQSQSTPGNFVPPMLSPSLHEGVFLNVSGDLAIERVKAWLGAGRDAAERARAAAIAIHGDETLSEGARHVRAEDYAVRITQPVLRRHDEETARLASDIASCERRLKGPPPPPALQASEIRSALRSMTPKERAKAINTALQEGDDAVIGAALDGARMLSGLSGLETELLRLRWANERLPNEVERLAALQKAAEHLHRGGQILLTHSLAMADRQIVQRAKASQAKAAAAITAATAA